MWSSFASRLVCCDYFLPSCPAQRKYSPLFQIFATFCAEVATELTTCPLIFATQDKQSWWQQEFCSEYSETHTYVCGKIKYIAIYMIDPFVRGQTVKSFAWTPCYCGEVLPTKDIKELSTGYLTNSTIMLGSSGFWLLLFGWGFCLELLPAYTMTW